MHFVRSALSCLGTAPFRAVIQSSRFPHDCPRLVELLQEALGLDLALRTSVSAAFDVHDGRRQIFRVQCEERARDDARANHLYAALPQWYSCAIQLALSVESLFTALQEHARTLGGNPEENAVNRESGLTLPQSLERICEDVMEKVLNVPLLGCPGNKPLEERALCYAAKFVLDSIYWLLIAASCWHAKKRGVPGRVHKYRCDCPPCLLILQVRKKFMAIGPAFRMLTLALLRPPSGHRASTEKGVLAFARQLLPDVNALLLADLDLYALQFLPCIWGKWLAAVGHLAPYGLDPPGVAEHARPESAGTANVGGASAGSALEAKLRRLERTPRREDKETIFALESLRLVELWEGLGLSCAKAQRSRNTAIPLASNIDNIVAANS